MIEERPVSNAIAERLGVQHASPQAILVKDGASLAQFPLEYYVRFTLRKTGQPVNTLIQRNHELIKPTCQIAKHEFCRMITLKIHERTSVAFRSRTLERIKVTVTIYDVAREAGVSMATVSRVVNNNPNVKPQTRKKVFEAIERLGYRPNAVARGLASKKTTTVGVVIPDIANANFAEVARGIEDIANMYHYNIILCNADKRKDKEIRVINTLLGETSGRPAVHGRRRDGRAYSGFQYVERADRAVRHDGRAGTMPSVDIDHEAAAFDAVQKLISEGHKSIAMISGTLQDPANGYARFQGLQAALKKPDCLIGKISSGRQLPVRIGHRSDAIFPRAVRTADGDLLRDRRDGDRSDSLHSGFRA